MKEINGYLLVEVPEESGFHMICKNKEDDGEYLSYDPDMNNRYGGWQDHQLPKGNYSIIGLAKDLDWGNKKDLLEHEWDGTHYWYRNYLQNGEMLKDINKSFDSLLRANNLNPNTTLILKKIL